MMMNSKRNYVILDCETTIKNKGSPFTKSNKLCLIGLKDNEGYHEFPIEYGEDPYGSHLAECIARIRAADLLVGFNVKFDLHWIKRYANDIEFPPVFDVQLAYFILGNQRQGFPSLDQVSIDYGFGSKYDVVRNEYWDHGIDTPSVPYDVLAEYTKHDVELTESCFWHQARILKDDPRLQLFKLQCEDLKILQEMEWNGLYYNLGEAARRGLEAHRRIEEINGELRDIVGVDWINWNSDDHISSVLYGGTIFEPYRFKYIRTLKDGTEKEHERWEERGHTLPPLLKPNKRLEVKPTKGMDDFSLQKLNDQRILDGKRPYIRHYSCAEPVLRSIRGNRKVSNIVGRLLEKSKLDKLDGTYYNGMIKTFQAMEWSDDHMHGNFNQCAAVTGRLSSSNPNLQNFAGVTKELFYSRYVE